MKFTCGLVVVLAGLSFDAAGQASPRLTYENGIIFVRGLGLQPTAPDLSQSGWNEILSIYTHDAFLKQVNQTVAGQYIWSGDSISFKPAYPFAGGNTYHVFFSGQAFSKYTGTTDRFPADHKLELVVEIPRKESSSTMIESAYPQGPVLPENLLRMYICFSAPMMPGEAYEHIKLFNGKGEHIEKAFLVVDQELWDIERKRFTILFDPGRIKRGLKSNVELGPPLKEGETYHLIIDSTWRDVNGNHLQSGMTKDLFVTTPQREKLDINQVKINAPRAGSRAPLMLLFDRPMDHVLASKYIWIQDALSTTVDGKFEMTNDKTLQFIPDRAWQPNNYTVNMSPLLEDVAGNNFNNPFDLDLSRASRVNSTVPLQIELTIKPSVP